MLFIWLTFLSALSIESIGTLISILGLSALFSNNPIIIVMAVALDVGKLVTVSFVYKYWQKVNWLMKSYMTIAAIILVFITSMGAFGFLSGEFQKAIASNSQQNVKIQALTDEQTRLQKRKDQIDKQIAELPSTYSRGRVTVMNGFKEETTRINTRLAKIDEELPALKIENIDKSVKIGPILYIAEAFNTTPEIAVKWVILTIIFVFDPLAIALLLAGNFLLAQRNTTPTSAPTPAPPPTKSKATRKQKSNRTVQKDIAKFDYVIDPIQNQISVKPIPPIINEIIKEEEDDVFPVAVPEQEPPKQRKPRITKSKLQRLTIEENPNGHDVVKQVKPEVPSAKFEEVDGNHADVSIEDDKRRIKSTNDIVSQYKDSAPAVSVGGPFPRS